MKNKMKQTYSSRLMREARLAKGLSQRDVAKKMGYSSPQYLSNLERALTGIPRESIKKYSKIFGVPEQKFKEAILADFRDELGI